ncbi:MAG TPA: Gfo/Idh/MocA family oxidoreductase [Bryobacteraceae bacterium]|nr:Gfo/Idh/MocA family oxidoreductase [Bryobacteraceae bacterium]
MSNGSKAEKKAHVGDRRNFLKGTLAGAACVLGFPTIIPASALGAEGTTAPSDRITLGCIGVGRQGTGDMRGFLQHDDVRVVAICDVQETARKAAKALVDARNGDKSCATYNDFRELLGRKDIDALLMATGERWTPYIGIEAARLGKHMYYEKPCALTVENAKAIRAAVKQSGVVFQFGAQQRSSQYFRFACELVRNGKIGQLKTIAIASSGGGGRLQPEAPKDPPPGFDWDMWLGPAPWMPYSDLRTSVYWLRISDYGLGNLAGGWGIHDLDIAQWVNNSDDTTPISVEGTGTLYDDIRDTVATYDIEHTYANGVKIKFMDGGTARRQFTQFGPGNSDVLIGTEGWIWVSRDGIKTQPESLIREIIGPNDKHVIGGSDFTQEAILTGSSATLHAAAGGDHRTNFLDSIRTGRPNVSPVDVAAHDEMIAQMADIAVRLKRKLHWDPVKEEFIDDEQANRRLAKTARGPWRTEVPDASGTA